MNHPKTKGIVTFYSQDNNCQPDDKHTLVYYAILPLEQKESAVAVPVPGQMGGETDHGKG